MMFNTGLVGRLYQEAGIFNPRYLGTLNHMMGVTHVAGFLAHKLNQQQNLGIDIELVETGAMLHDIGKIFDESPRGHVIEGVKFLHEQGIDEKIIRIVQRHQVWSFEKGEIPDSHTWEEKLVFLADLVFGDHITVMNERVEDLIDRYSKEIPPGRVEWLREKSQEIHREISEIILPKILPF